MFPGIAAGGRHGGDAEADHCAIGEEFGFDLYLAKPVAPGVLETLLALERDRLSMRQDRGIRHD